jgi:hypothetical protein
MHVSVYTVTSITGPAAQSLVLWLNTRIYTEAPLCRIENQSRVAENPVVREAQAAV